METAERQWSFCRAQKISAHTPTRQKALQERNSSDGNKAIHYAINKFINIKIIIVHVKYKFNLSQNRYIRLLSNVLDWQKSQERNALTIVQNVRVKSDLRQISANGNFLPAAASIVQQPKGTTCNNPIRSESFGHSFDKNGNALMLLASQSLLTRNIIKKCPVLGSNSATQFLIDESKLGIGTAVNGHCGSKKLKMKVDSEDEERNQTKNLLPNRKRIKLSFIGKDT